MKYDVFGPFKVPRKDGGLVANAKALGRFWNEEVEEDEPGLSTASGCYIFGIGATPWYVGQAKNTFKGECFKPDKLNHYDGILAVRQGRPILHLLARKTPTGSFKRRLRKSEADSLETLLIYKCLCANPDLLNTSRTSFFKKAKIPGLLNKEARSSSEKFLKRLLNLE